MFIKVIASSLVLGVALNGGCGEETITPCGQTEGDGFLFDNYGVCCHASQQVVQEQYRDRLCDLTLPVTVETPDAGWPVCPDPPTCGDDHLLVCLPETEDPADGGEDEDAGECPVLPPIVVCPAGQELVRDPDRCVDLDAPDAGDVCPEIPACPEPPVCEDGPDAGEPVCPEPPVCEDLPDAGTCDEPPECPEVPVCPEPTDCPTCGPGSLLDTATAQCMTPPPPPPGPCPEGQARTNAGTCVQVFNPPPTPKLEVSFLAPPLLLAQLQREAAPAQTHVPFGSVCLRNLNNPHPAETTAVALGLLAADNPAGPFAAGASGTVRANERITGCLLREWPPLVGAFGPVAPAADDRLLFPLAVPVTSQRCFDVTCTLADLPPVGDADAYAADLAAGTEAVSVNGAQRTPLAVSDGSRNGNPPLAKVTVGPCSYPAESDTGAPYRVRTRPAFSRDATSPTGFIGNNGTFVIAAFRAALSPRCGDGRLHRVAFRVDYSETNNPGWANVTAANIASRVRVSYATAASTPVGTPVLVASGTRSFTFQVDIAALNDQTIAADSFRVLRVYMDLRGGAGNTVQVTPHDVVGWIPDGAPPGTPTLMRAPDFAAAPGSVISVI